ncbi:MAG: hypothetical protein FD137_179 [Spirochaetes bacterium]|nr:MAG: hypothetical protein FD137_179 [Spirochaetota bacterium]
MENGEPPDLPTAFTVSGGKTIALRPSLSDIPYLVSARNEVKIMPSSEAWFAIALPPVLKFMTESQAPLHSFHPFTVSKTWFGDKTAGNLCLSLPIELDPSCNREQNFNQEMDEAIKAKSSKYLNCRSLIQCKLVVRNRSKEPIETKRLAIFTDLLSLYEKGTSLVSDTVVIVATQDGTLQNNIDSAPYRGLPKIHSAPNAGLSEVLVKRGVSFLRSIAGI